MDAACARHPQGYLELATEYMRLHGWAEAARVARRGVEKAAPYPLLLYYAAFAEEAQGHTEAAAALRGAVRTQELQLDIFPFRSEDVDVLNSAVQADPADANALVLLADLLYSRERRGEAIELWRRAVAAAPQHFFALRDLGMALLLEGTRDEGLRLLTRAFETRPEHLATAIVLANVNAGMGNAEAARDAFRRSLARNPGSDALIERLASLEAQTGNPAQALALMTGRSFEATHQSYALLHLYRAVRLTLALEEFERKNAAGALAHIQAAARPPASLGVDDFASVASSRLLLFEALLEQAGEDVSAAQASWKAAAATSDDDVETEGLFRAIALHKTGQRQQAADFFREFDTVNEQRKSDRNRALRAHANYTAGIYAAFKGNPAEAARSFRRALEVDQSFLYARQALAWLDAGLLKGLQE